MWCASRPRPDARPKSTGPNSAAERSADSAAHLVVMVLGFSRIRALHAEAVTAEDLSAEVAGVIWTAEESS
jgi:hypothetical protein